MLSKSEVEELMSVMSKSTNSDSTAARELRTKMQGRVVSWGDDDYAHTRRVWNGAVENQPALFAMCETSADVQAAVRSARQHGFALSVRGGGHDWRDAPCALTGSSLTSAG
jgi:FAD/FMN-containing dehydrogenase